MWGLGRGKFDFQVSGLSNWANRGAIILNKGEGRGAEMDKEENKLESKHLQHEKNSNATCQ